MGPGFDNDTDGWPVGRPVLGDRLETVDLALRDVAACHGDADAYVAPDGERLTFVGWDEAADRAAAGLADLGVGPGDVVLFHLASCIEYAVAYLAAMRLGAISSGINPRLGQTEVASIVARSAPRLVVHDDAVPAPPGARGLRRSEVRQLHGAAGGVGVRPDSSRPVAIVWTSGTTGDPKGAVFDHRNLMAVTDGTGAVLRAFDRRFAAGPFAHMGYMLHVHEDIAFAIANVISATPWSARGALGAMAGERVTIGQGVPSQWRLVLDHPDMASADLSSLRLCITGAAPVEPALVHEMQERLGCFVLVGYASTESGLATGTVPGDRADRIARTVGRARRNVEVRVVDEHGRPLEVGSTGRVQCRSGAVMRGYLGDPERTSAVLAPDGWLTMGDSGWLDEAGYLTLVGRTAECYIRGGYNVFPAEVERELSFHPAVVQVAVVAKHDRVLGEVGVAFVVPSARATPTLEELRTFVGRSLADYKAPDMLVLVDELPLTAMGKLDRGALGERAAVMARPPVRG